MCMCVDPGVQTQGNILEEACGGNKAAPAWFKMPPLSANDLSEITEVKQYTVWAAENSVGREMDKEGETDAGKELTKEGVRDDVTVKSQWEMMEKHLNNIFIKRNHQKPEVNSSWAEEWKNNREEWRNAPIHECISKWLKGFQTLIADHILIVNQKSSRP